MTYCIWPGNDQVMFLNGNVFPIRQRWPRVDTWVWTSPKIRSRWTPRSTGEKKNRSFYGNQREISWCCNHQKIKDKLQNHPKIDSSCDASLHRKTASWGTYGTAKQVQVQDACTGRDQSCLGRRLFCGWWCHGAAGTMEVNMIQPIRFQGCKKKSDHWHTHIYEYVQYMHLFIYLYLVVCVLIYLFILILLLNVFVITQKKWGMNWPSCPAQTCSNCTSQTSLEGNACLVTFLNHGIGFGSLLMGTQVVNPPLGLKRNMKKVDVFPFSSDWESDQCHQTQNYPQKIRTSKGWRWGYWTSGVAIMKSTGALVRGWDLRSPRVGCLKLLSFDCREAIEVSESFPCGKNFLQNASYQTHILTCERNEETKCSDLVVKYLKHGYPGTVKLT